MLQPACTCPTCGSEYPFDVPRVDLNRNIIICRKGWRKLTPREAEIMAVVIDRYPRMATMADIFAGIYGMADEPENATYMLRVYITKLRSRLKPIGWTLINIHSRGYRLAEWEGGNG